MSEGKEEIQPKSRVIRKVAGAAARVVAASAILVGGARAIESKSPTQPFKDVTNASRDIGDAFSSDNETGVQRLSSQFDKIFIDVHKNEPINDNDTHHILFETADKDYLLSSSKEGYRHLEVHDKATDLNTDYSFSPDKVERTARELKTESSVPTLNEGPSYSEVVTVLTAQEVSAVGDELANAFGNKTKAEIFKPFNIPTISSE